MIPLETPDDRHHRLDPPAPPVKDDDGGAGPYVEDAGLLTVHLDEVVGRGDVLPLLSGEVAGATGGAGVPSDSYVVSAEEGERVEAARLEPS